jgi:hypothetical protein
MNRNVVLVLVALAGGCTAVGTWGAPTAPTPEPAPPATAVAPLSPGERLLRRLSRSEYDRTAADLLGIPSDHLSALAPDTVVNGFDNGADALVVSGLLADQLRAAAEDLAERAAPLLPCQDTLCLEGFVRSFGARAFRRPLSDAEVARYLALHQDLAASGGFRLGLQWVVTAMLESPYFLYRSEIGDADGLLSPYEIASELSYLLTGTMPDGALFDAAASGALASPDGIAAQVRRLLADPRAKWTFHRFVSAWLRFDLLEQVPKDPAIYPEFADPALRASMRSESERFVDEVLEHGDATLGELLSAPFTFVDPGLARLYGLPFTGTAAVQKVSLAGAARGGLLTQGAVLSTAARPDSSSPILRGKLVREQLLCQALPPPPPGVVANPPPLDPHQTARQRFAAHDSVQPCAGCHRLMDPIGLGFEDFDGIGRYRTIDGGQPIDASGEIVGSPHSDGRFDGVLDLARTLAASSDVEACFARQWFRFATGLGDGTELEPEVEAFAARFMSRGGDVLDLLAALTEAPHFVRRAP